AQPVAIAAGDINGDSLDDLVVANRGDGSVTVLLATGAQSFSAHQTLTTNAGPDGVALGDVNGDGRLDLAGAEADADTVSVWLGDGTGGFTRQETVTVGHAPSSVAIVDDQTLVVNGDQRPDLIVANLGSNDIAVVGSSSNGSLSVTGRFVAGRSPVALV